MTTQPEKPDLEDVMREVKRGKWEAIAAFAGSYILTGIALTVGAKLGAGTMSSNFVSYVVSPILVAAGIAVAVYAACKHCRA